MMDDKLSQLVASAGAYEQGVVDTARVGFSPEVRGMCEVNTCRKYGTTWACPPGLGSLEACEARVRRYDKMLVFTGKYDMEDSFDYEAMTEGMADFKKICRRLNESVAAALDDFLILSNEGCDLCEACTYPDAPCRFPDRTHGSIEGYGIFVSELAKQAGIHYINGQNTVTYFGAILYHDQ